MTTTNPAIITGQEAGLDDRQYIQRLRDLLEDNPKDASEQTSGLGSALRYALSVVPINDDDYLQCLVNGTPLTIIQTPNPTAGQVFIDMSSGRMIFGTPPAAGVNNIVVYKTTVRWRDSVMKEALMDGVRAMFPKLGKYGTDTSISLATLNWNYALPSIFNDMSIKIIEVGVRNIPASTNYFRPITGWERTSPTNLRIPPSQWWSPGSSVEVRYDAPYSSLSEVEPKAQMLPIWYAAGMLLGFKEAGRVKSSTQNVTAEASANPAGAQQNAGSWFMRQFTSGLNGMSRPRRSPRATNVYNMG